MEPLNIVEMRGRVGSHTITLGDDGYWKGWFDLHVVTKDGYGVYRPMVFDCRVVEDGKYIKDLGAGIGGCIVNVRGRLILFPETHQNECYILVTRLAVVGTAQDELKAPDPPKTEQELNLEKGVLF